MDESKKKELIKLFSEIDYDSPDTMFGYVHDSIALDVRFDDLSFNTPAKKDAAHKTILERLSEPSILEKITSYTKDIINAYQNLGVLINQGNYRAIYRVYLETGEFQYLIEVFSKLTIKQFFEICDNPGIEEVNGYITRGDETPGEYDSDDDYDDDYDGDYHDVNKPNLLN